MSTKNLLNVNLLIKRYMKIEKTIYYTQHANTGLQTQYWQAMKTIKHNHMQVLWIDYALSAGFSLVGGGLGISHVLYAPLITAVLPQSLLIMAKNFFRYVFNFCMTKANLTSITSLRMQTLLSY